MTPSQILKAALPPETYKVLPKSNLARQLIVDLACGETVRPTRLSGRSYTDNYHDVRKFARFHLGPCSEGNDAERGGKHGRMLRLLPNGFDSETAQAIRKNKAAYDKLAGLLTEWAAQSKRDAESDAIRQFRDVLLQWREDGHPHPAPWSVIEAKIKSGLSWSRLQDATSTLSCLTPNPYPTFNLIHPQSF